MLYTTTISLLSHFSVLFLYILLSALFCLFIFLLCVTLVELKIHEPMLLISLLMTAVSYNIGHRMVKDLCVYICMCVCVCVYNEWIKTISIIILMCNVIYTLTFYTISIKSEIFLLGKVSLAQQNVWLYFSHPMIL